MNKEKELILKKREWDRRGRERRRRGTEREKGGKREKGRESEITEGTGCLGSGSFCSELAKTPELFEHHNPL